MRTFVSKHLCICSLVAKNEAPLIILEYCPHGNLREFLRTKRDIYEPEWKDVDNVQFSITDVANFALHIAKGMEFLISRKVAYNIILHGEVFVSVTRQHRWWLGSEMLTLIIGGKNLS